VQKTISDQNRVCYENKAQEQKPKRVAMYPPLSVFFSMANSMYHFHDPLHLTTSLLQLLKGFGNIENER
jgi:hypothetical protein